MTTGSQSIADWPLLVGAQPVQGQPPWLTIMLWAAFLIVVAVIGGTVIMWVRGRMVGSSMKGAEAAAGLSGLRALRDSGEMSQEEYDAARKSLAHRVAGHAPPRPMGVPKKPVGHDPDTKVAKPGFDLTGAPLPRPRPPPPAPPRSSAPPPKPPPARPPGAAG